MSRLRTFIVMALSSLALSMCTTDNVPSFSNVGFNVNSIFCTTNSHCILAGFSGSKAVIEIRDNGQYLQSKIPRSVVYITSVDCPSGNLCFAIALANFGLSYSILKSNDAGKTWQWSYKAAYTGPQGNITCATPEFCITPATVYENLSPQIMVYKNGVWSQFQVSNFAGHIDWASCSNTGFCALSGTTSVNVGGFEYNEGLIVYTSDFGKSFTSIDYPYLANVNLISCDNDDNGSFCMAAGYNYENSAFLLSGLNGNFTQTPIPEDYQSVTSLNCMTDYCYVGGISPQNKALFSQINYRKNQVAETILNGSDSVEASAVACISNDTCFVSGTNQLETSSAIYQIDLKSLSVAPKIMKLQNLLPDKRPLNPVVVAGDSIALTLDFGASDAAFLKGYSFINAAIIGCGVMGEIVTQDEGVNFGSGLSACSTWQEDYSNAFKSNNPKVALLLVGRWEVANEVNGNTITHIGNPSFDSALYNNLVSAIKILSNNNKTKVVVLTCPYFFSGYQKNGTLWPEDQPWRVILFNQILNRAANQFKSEVSVFNLNSLLSVNNKYARVISGIPVRTQDGVHFTERGAQFIAGRLLPYLSKVLTK